MRLKPEQLGVALKKNLLPIYFVTGDEPLQMGEVADTIRLAAKTAGYITREICSVGSGFEWYELAETANALSIFGDKKIVDLRMPTAKPGNEGAKALCSYCQRLPEETLLLITAPKIDKASQQTKWFQALDKAGVVIQIWPLEGASLIQWLQQRSQKRGLHLEQDAIKALASRVEGNLLAASQEIEKLYILHGNAPISRQMIEDAVADSARFDVFKLTDSILAGRFNRATKILNGLKAEDTAASIVVWALAREARVLINIKIALNQGENKEAAFKKNRLWDKRKQLVNTALSRMKMKDFQQVLLLSSKADRQIKGQEAGDAWETLSAACLMFCLPD